MSTTTDKLVSELHEGDMIDMTPTIDEFDPESGPRIDSYEFALVTEEPLKTSLGWLLSTDQGTYQLPDHWKIPFIDTEHLEG